MTKRHASYAAATPAHFLTLFRKASPVKECPEKSLIIAILWVAVTDILTKGKLSERDHAEAFFRDGAYRIYCELVDLDPDWVGMVLRDYAGIECGKTWVQAAAA